MSNAPSTVAPLQAAMSVRDYGRCVSDFWLRYLTWQARIAMRVVLRSFDDRMLRDIGLQRSEIEPTLLELDRTLRRRHR